MAVAGIIIFLGGRCVCHTITQELTSSRATQGLQPGAHVGVTPVLPSVRLATSRPYDCSLLHGMLGKAVGWHVQEEVETDMGKQVMPSTLLKLS